MSELKLLTSQRNDIFKCVQDQGLVPTDFQWGTAVGDGRPYTKLPVLVHRSTEFEFKINRGENGFYCRFSPGNESVWSSAGPLNYGELLN